MDFYKICLGAVGLVVAYGICDRTPPLEYLSVQQVKDAHPGEEAELLFQVYRHRRCHTEVESRVFDSERHLFHLPGRTFQNVGPVGNDNYISMVDVSEKASLGTATVRYGLTWRCNPTHWVWPIQTVIDVPLNITKK